MAKKAAKVPAKKLVQPQVNAATQTPRINRGGTSKESPGAPNDPVDQNPNATNANIKVK